MKNVTLQVSDLLSILDFAAVEKRLGALPGFQRVAMNAGSSTASIAFDEAVTSPERLAREIEACGFHCRGEIAPRHGSVPDQTAVGVTDPRAPSQTEPLDHRAAGHLHPGAGSPSAKGKPDHDAMDMQDMLRDMRNR